MKTLTTFPDFTSRLACGYKTIISVIGCFILAISIGMSQDFDYSFDESYQVSTPAKMNIKTSDGNIAVTPTTGSEIKVYYVVRKNGKLLKIDRQELEKEVILEVNHTGNSLDIKVEHHLKNSLMNFNPINVGFRIFVPEQTSTILHTSDGNISLDGLAGDQECKTSDGNISVTKINGQATATTSDGNISLNDINGLVSARTSDGNVSLEYITGDVQATTSDGNIHLGTIDGDVTSVTSDGDIKLSKVNGNASARTSDGHIAFEDLSGSLDAVTSDGNIAGNFTRLEDKLTARASDGNVDVTIPDQLGLDLDIRGESLSVPLTNFTGKSDKRTIRGQANGGGIAVSIQASGGNIRLAYR